MGLLEHWKIIVIAIIVILSSFPVYYLTIDKSGDLDGSGSFDEKDLELLVNFTNGDDIELHSSPDFNPNFFVNGKDIILGGYALRGYTDLYPFPPRLHNWNYITGARPLIQEGNTCWAYSTMSILTFFDTNHGTSYFDYPLTIQQQRDFITYIEDFYQGQSYTLPQVANAWADYRNQPNLEVKYRVWHNDYAEGYPVPSDVIVCDITFDHIKDVIDHGYVMHVVTMDMHATVVVGYAQFPTNLGEKEHALVFTGGKYIPSLASNYEEDIAHYWVYELED